MIDRAVRELVRADDLHVRARCVEPPFLRVVVHDDGDRLRGRPREVHQGVPFRARPVRPDAPSLGAEPLDEIRKLRHVRPDALAEPEVHVGVGDPELAFVVEHRDHPVARRPLADTAREHADRPPVDLREALDVEDHQTVHAHELGERVQTEIREMLVIGGVEFVPPDEVEDVGDFDHQDPLRSEREPDRLDELVHVVDMREHVRRGHDARTAVPRDGVARDRGTPVLRDRGDAASGCFGGEVPGRIDAEDAHSEPAEAAQKQPVVARDVERPVAGGGAADAHGRRGELGAVIAKRLRRRADVQIVAEHDERRRAARPREGIDELVILDITATIEQRRALADTIRAVARELFIPLAVGGGIRTEADAAAAVDLGHPHLGAVRFHPLEH